jgi:hypothetical protein
VTSAKTTDSARIGQMSTNPGGAVYGTITVGALMAAETGQRETYAETVAAVLIALLLYWLAHSYAALAGERLSAGTKLTPAALGEELVHELSMLAGAAVPLLAVLIGWIAGAALATALTAGVVTAAAMVVVIEVVAAIRAELSGRELLAQASVGAVLGCLVFALKAVLH